MSGEIILETQNLTKEFAGFVAVSGVNLRVERGTIHALIGPNGAGKTERAARECGKHDGERLRIERHD